jgi:putative exosortase-associated protein (TIGR04073 family)
MKALQRFALLVCVSGLVVGTAVAADAERAGDPQDRSVAGGMVSKAARGLGDVVTSPIELPMQTWKGYQKGKGFGGTTLHTVLGLFRGVTHTGGRLAHGAVDFCLFIVPNPEDNDGVGKPLDARWPWQQGEQHGLFDPTLSDGLAPYGRKLARGAGNTLGGVLEVPGQIRKGVDQGRIGTGVFKGFWYFLGRETHGVCDLGLFLLPNPNDTAGSVFEERWPWYALIGEYDRPVERPQQ